MKAYHNSVVLRNDGEDPSTLKLDLNAGITQPVTVRISSTQALASIFDLDEVATANPLITDSNGNYAFKANDNIYDIIVSEGTANEVKLEKVEIIEIQDPNLIINDLSQSYEFATMQELLDSVITFPDDKKASIAGYFAGVIGGGKFVWDASGDKTEHDGGLTIDPDVAFYTSGNQASVYTWYNGNTSPVGTGVWRRELSSTVIDDWYGILTGASYVFFDAFVNRKAYEKMINNTSQNDFTFASKDNDVWIVGSINGDVSNKTIRHLAGCHIKGRYDDPVNHPGLMQAGHMFGFVSYVDPYPEGNDPALTGLDVDNINYILDGKISTVYDASHSQPHNNNVFGFYDGADCSVTGEGGIEASDHNGVGFDGFGRNCKVDLAYIKNYDDRAVTMKGTAGVRDSATINIGKLSGATRNGTVSESILVTDLDYANVTVGDALLNLASLGTFIKTDGCNLVDVNVGYLENAIFWVALQDTGQVNINGGRYKNITYIGRRGGTAPAAIAQKKLRIKGVECVESLNSTIYLSQIAPNEGSWNELEVTDCDFSAATGTFTPYAGKTALSEPSIYNYRNNIAPTGWVYDSDVFNKQLDNINTSVGSSSFVYNTAGTNSDNPYQKINVQLTHSADSFRYEVLINIRDLLLTSADYRQSVVVDDGSILNLTSVRSGTSFTFTLTASAGTGSISSYSLRN